MTFFFLSRKSTDGNKTNERRKEHEFVGEGIDELAEIGHPVESARKEPVEHVGNECKHVKNETDHVLLMHEQNYERDNHQYS